MADLSHIDITENLFQAIDTIVARRIKQQPLDTVKTAYVVDARQNKIGKYIVTEDNHFNYLAISGNTSYKKGDQVEVLKKSNGDCFILDTANHKITTSIFDVGQIVWLHDYPGFTKKKNIYININDVLQPGRYQITEQESRQIQNLPATVEGCLIVGEAVQLILFQIFMNKNGQYWYRIIDQTKEADKCFGEWVYYKNYMGRKQGNSANSKTSWDFSLIDNHHITGSILFRYPFLSNQIVQDFSDPNNMNSHLNYPGANTAEEQTGWHKCSTGIQCTYPIYLSLPFPMTNITIVGNAATSGLIISNTSSCGQAGVQFRLFDLWGGSEIGQYDSESIPSEGQSESIETEGEEDSGESDIQETEGDVFAPLPHVKTTWIKIQLDGYLAQMPAAPGGSNSSDPTKRVDPFWEQYYGEGEGQKYQGCDHESFFNNDGTVKPESPRSIIKSYLVAQEGTKDKEGRKFVYAHNVDDEWFNGYKYNQEDYDKNEFRWRSFDSSRSRVINDNHGNAIIVCDTFMLLILRGLHYEDSPYGKKGIGLDENGQPREFPNLPSPPTENTEYKKETFFELLKTTNDPALPTFERLYLPANQNNYEWVTKLNEKLLGQPTYLNYEKTQIITPNAESYRARFYGLNSYFTYHMLWTLYQENLIFTDINEARSGDLAFWCTYTDNKSYTYFDGVTHVGMIIFNEAEEDTGDINVIDHPGTVPWLYEMTYYNYHVEDENGVLQTKPGLRGIPLKDKVPYPTYFARINYGPNFNRGEGE